MDNTMQDMVKQFHRVYNSYIGQVPTLYVGKITQDLRIRLIEEEFTELKDAIAADDLVETADALADLTYVVIGTAITFGINLDKVFVEVHHSNMSKLDVNGKPIKRDDGKILKGPNFFEPDIASILKV